MTSLAVRRLQLVQASVVSRDIFLRDFALTRIENMHHFSEFT